MDLSRQRLDVHLLDEDGRTVEVTAVRPDADALRTLTFARHSQPVIAGPAPFPPLRGSDV